MLPCELKRTGGSWLGATRGWIQRRRINGEDVIWGSDEVLEPPMTVADAEDMASYAASATMEHQEKLIEALLNMLGVFDNPAMRQKVDNEWTRDAIKSARLAIIAAGGKIPSIVE